MPRRPRQKPASPPEEPTDQTVEVQDPEVEEEVSEPEEEPSHPTPAKRGRGRPRRGASVEFRASGDAEEVRRAIGNYSERDGAEDSPEENPEEDERIASALADSKNFVRVHRIYPRRWRGEKADRHCERYRCPITREDIEEDIFARFGGKRFLVTVHPNTPTGESKTIASLTFENPDTEEPIFPEAEDPEDPQALADRGIDPTSVEDEDPMAQAEHALNQQIRLQTRMQQLQSLKEAAQNMRVKNEREGDGKNKDDQIRLLEERVGLDRLERQIDQKVSAVERQIEKLIERETASAKGNGGGMADNMTPIFLQMMRSSDAKFNAMMTAFTAAVSGAKEKKEDPLDTLVKLKSLLGKDDSGKASRLEERAMEMLFDRLEGGETDEESDVKYAVKQLVPVARSYIDKKLAGTEAPAGPTEEDFKKAVREEAMKITQKTLGDMQKKGYLVRVPQTGDKKGIPYDPKKKVGAPEGDPKSRKEDAAAQEPETGEPEEEERDDVKTPPSPQSPAYDRGKAVNFVLDTILVEFETCPEDSYVPGDIMDRLDDEFLEKFLTISTGDELKNLVRPYADAEKLSKVEEAGKSDRRKSWLTRMVVTAQDEIRREWETADNRSREEK